MVMGVPMVMEAVPRTLPSVVEGELEHVRQQQVLVDDDPTAPRSAMRVQREPDHPDADGRPDEGAVVARDGWGEHQRPFRCSSSGAGR